MCVCVFVVEVFEVYGRLPDVASVSEVHISNSELLLTNFILSGVRMTPRQTLRYGGPPGSSPLKVQNTKILLTEASILTNAGVTSLIVICKGAPIIESRGRGRLSAPQFV